MYFVLLYKETDHSHEEVTERKVLVGDIIDLLTSLVPCYQVSLESIGYDKEHNLYENILYIFGN